MVRDSVDCWIYDFHDYMKNEFGHEDHKQLSKKEYESYLAFWAMDTKEGQAAVNKNRVGF